MQDVVVSLHRIRILCHFTVCVLVMPDSQHLVFMVFVCTVFVVHKVTSALSLLQLFLFQLLRGLSYCHARHILHR